MKIRSITYFCDPKWPLDDDVLQQAGNFISEARLAYEAAGSEVQTVRLATTPFPRLLALDSDFHDDKAIEFANALEDVANAKGFDYIAIGPALPEFPQSYEAIPKILAATENIFASAVMSSHDVGVSLPAVRACAEIIHTLAPHDPNGFANLYFAALANVQPGAPFFPAAYHGGGAPFFAIATEAADLAVEAFSEASSLDEARQRLMEVIQSQGEKLTHVANSLTRRFADSQNLNFGGIDFSLAPFPEQTLSLGTAFERLGVPAIGLHGSLAAAAIIADTIDKADFLRAGFSGLMLPVLEDSTLAKRAAEGVLTIKDLLLFSAACGTGLDTVPLPGNITPEQLTAILLDLAALAQRLNKPLTARLMPIPGKKMGDVTDFDFAFFANSRVMAVDTEPLEGKFVGDESFYLSPRLE